MAVHAKGATALAVALDASASDIVRNGKAAGGTLDSQADPEVITRTALHLPFLFVGTPKRSAVLGRLEPCCNPTQWVFRVMTKV